MFPARRNQDPQCVACAPKARRSLCAGWESVPRGIVLHRSEGRQRREPSAPEACCRAARHAESSSSLMPNIR
jgi:hypothetical protein